MRSVDLHEGALQIEATGQGQSAGQAGARCACAPYTTKSGYEHLEALVPKEEAERLRKTPFAAVQVRLLSSGSVILRQPNSLQRAFGPLVPKEEARCIRKISLAAVQVRAVNLP